MNKHPSSVKLLNRIFVILISVAVAGVLSAIFLTLPAQADSPIYVRPGGDDAACIGIVNVDYDPSVAPLCAVKTIQRALRLAGPANPIIFDAGSRTITIPPPTSSGGAGDISATAAVTLEVSKTDFPDPVSVGNALTYTVRIDNTGDMNASGVLLIDSLPQVGVVSVKSITTTHGTCNPPDAVNSISCLLGNLNASNSATVTIVVTPTAAGNLTNIAIARDAGSAFDVVTETTRFTGITDLSVSKADFPDPVIQGRPLTYTITITNSGLSAAATVDLTDYLPAGVILGSATPSQGSCGSGSIVTCTLGLMTNGATATVRLVVTPTVYGLITNTVTITGGDFDPNLFNNVFTQTTLVIPVADIGVSKSDWPDPVAAGATLTYTLIVSNAGPGMATGVTLTDTLPGAVSFNNASGNMLLMHLDEVTGSTSFADVSGNNYNGTCSGATCPTAGVSGRFSTALRFDGLNDFVSLANPPGLNLSGQITLMAWVNISSTTGLQDIIAHGFTTTPDPNAAVFLRVNSGDYEVGSWNGTNYLASFAIPLADVGNWVHLAGVYDGSAWRLYRNGTEVDSTSAVVGAVQVGDNWALGAKGDGSDRFFGGQIDEAAIFNRALTGPEIATLYQQALSGKVSTSQGSCGAVNGRLHCNLGDLAASSTATVTLRVTVASTATGTILNTVNVATTASDSNQTNNTDSEPTTIQGGPTGPGTVFLPIILKNFANPTISMYWNDWETVRDKVRPDNAGAGLTPDGYEDGLFRVTVNMGSHTKTVDSVILTTSQAPGIYWDTDSATSAWVLGIFDGGTQLNLADGTINRLVSGVFEVTLYASDVYTTSPLYSLFPPDTHTYTVTVHFDDSSSLMASARIPPPGPPPPPPQPPPPPPPTACQPVETITVGDTPRGLAVDETRQRVYAANYGNSSVSVINSSSNTVLRTITGITSANGLAYDSINNILWVTNYSSDQITPITDPDSASYSVESSIGVGNGPWGLAYDQVHNDVYVVNNLDSTVTIIDANTRDEVATLGGSFSQPFHVAANPVTGKVYVTNFGSHTVTVIDGTSVSKVIEIDSAEPYGVAVDETRNIVYVATVDTHRVAAINGSSDTLLGWAAFHRGFGDPARPVPMRAIAVNPDIGSAGDGGHVWTTTSTSDGSEANQALLIPKGWTAFFHYPVPCDVGLNPSEGIAINRSLDRAYVTSGANPGMVTVFDDPASPPLVPFTESEGIGVEVFTVR